MQTTVLISPQWTLDQLIASPTAKRAGIKEQFQIDLTILNNLIISCKYLLNDLKIEFPNLVITSGYRCKRLNDMVGGKIDSQHLTGQAFDIRNKNRTGLQKIWMFLRNEMDVDQVIMYNGFIHVSFVSFEDNRNQFINLSKKGG